MELAEWIDSITSIEKGYAIQCFKFWRGLNGGVEPPIPEGISSSRASILRYHCKSLAEDSNYKRKVGDLTMMSFRIPKNLKAKVEFSSAQINVNYSIFIRACIEVGMPIINEHPGMIKFFDCVIPK